MVFGGRVFLDANHNIMLHSALISYGNEDKAAWKKLNDETNNGNRSYDARGTMDISDMDKGADAAFPESFRHAGHLFDVLHRKKAIAKIRKSKGGGSDAVDWFTRAHSSRSIQELEHTKAQMPVKTAALLENIPDANQYPIAAADAGRNGIVSSSYSESWNRAIKNPRAFPFAAAFKEVVVSESGRFRKAQGDAAGCRANLPPRVHEDCSPFQHASSRIDTSKVTFMNLDKTVALVPRCNGTSQMAKVDLAEAKTGGPGACDVLCMSVSMYPCPHVLAAAAAKGMGIMAIINPKLTAQNWKQQYEDLDFPLPSAADVEKHSGLINRNICLPPAFKRPKGRPRSLKRQKGFMEKPFTKKRKMTCQICYAKGHTKKNCPNEAAIAATIVS